MSQDSTAIERDLIERLFGDKAFPAFPFKNETWIGLLLNRDLHGLPGLPMVIFDALVSSLEAREEMPFTFVPALTSMEGADAFPCIEVRDWRSYLALLGRLDFCPEYYLRSAGFSVLLWFDPESVLIGGDADLVQNVAEEFGGMECLARRCADEFGVALEDSSSEVAAFIRSIGHLREPRPAGEARYAR
ncbi:hypothetical protein [Stenotrophomonas bentonitica]|uniref:hypothetical protein n=1 Tax=Stenotrophomonas bentonitica TaxID=1450134 RepID=UPI00345E11E1